MILRRAFKSLVTGLICTLASLSAAEKLNPQQQAANDEYQLKALFLYNFANQVIWPDSAFRNANAKLRLCLFGDVPFAIFLDGVNGTLIGNRELQVLHTNLLRDIESGCQIVFVGKEQRVLLPQLWQDINYQFVLSVGEQPEFTQRGGIINLVRTADGMRMDVNVAQAVANGLMLHSDIKSIARQAPASKP